VTGGTGFIGSHTVESLLAEGFSVRCLIRPGRKDIGWLRGLPVEIVESHLTSSEDLLPHVKDAHYVFHVAGVTKAKSPRSYHRGNVLTTENLLRACVSAPRLKKFCFVSSLTACGPSRDGSPVDEDTPNHPITAYGVSKMQAEHACAQFFNKIPIVIVRPPTVYGSRDRDTFEMFRWVGFGIEPIFGDKGKSISLIHVRDLARALIAAAKSPRTAGKTYFAANIVSYTLHSIISRIAVLSGKRTTPLRFPKALLFGVAGLVEALSFIGPRPAVLSVDKARDLTQPHWVCDSSKLLRMVGFTPQISVDEGLYEALNWYKAQGWLS